MAVLESYVPAVPLTADFAFTGEDVAQGLKQGQFESLFQPKVEVKTGRLAGAETLGRWRHPERGFVNPRHFIDLADASGLMDPLTITMVRNAARCWRGLHRAGFEVPLSVNLSISSLTDPSFADRILAVVREEQVDPPQLIFEVTESLAASDLGATLENLSRLRIKGFGLSLDDYGTGYSSMQRLSRIPFTELKIDASFVKTASGNSQSYAMVESSIELARKLRIDAVGEGVETREEFDLLLTLGCPVAQGYYIARPMSATQLVDWAQARLHISASG
jgi:EAL domain-containing protein (putative c-di-GMP-specific phosphodiesterase class I)